MQRNRWPKGTWMKLRSGALLRTLMNTRGASNQDVALACGVGRTYVSALVNGRRDSMKPAKAERMALYFGVPVEVLFDPRTSPVSGQNYAPQEMRPTG